MSEKSKINDRKIANTSVTITCNKRLPKIYKGVSLYDTELHYKLMLTYI